MAADLNPPDRRTMPATNLQVSAQARSTMRESEPQLWHVFGADTRHPSDVTVPSRRQPDTSRLRAHERRRRARRRHGKTTARKVFA